MVIQTAKLGHREVTIKEALQIQGYALRKNEPKPQFSCDRCGWKVIALSERVSRSNVVTQSHFKHYSGHPPCTYERNYYSRNRKKRIIPSSKKRAPLPEKPATTRKEHFEALLKSLNGLYWTASKFIERTGEPSQTIEIPVRRGSQYSPQPKSVVALVGLPDFTNSDDQDLSLRQILAVQNALLRKEVFDIVSSLAHSGRRTSLARLMKDFQRIESTVQDTLSVVAAVRILDPMLPGSRAYHIDRVFTPTWKKLSSYADAFHESSKIYRDQFESHPKAVLYSWEAQRFLSLEEQLAQAQTKIMQQEQNIAVLQKNDDVLRRILRSILPGSFDAEFFRQGTTYTDAHMRARMKQFEQIKGRPFERDKKKRRYTKDPIFAMEFKDWLYTNGHKSRRPSRRNAQNKVAANHA